MLQASMSRLQSSGICSCGLMCFLDECLESARPRSEDQKDGIREEAGQAHGRSIHEKKSSTILFWRKLLLDVSNYMQYDTVSRSLREGHSCLP